MTKSPTKSHRSDSIFTKEEQIWLVCNAGNLPGAQIRRKFIIQFRKTNKHNVPCADKFKQLIQRFDASGCVTPIATGGHRPSLTPENKDRVQEYFEQNSENSIIQASRDLDMSFTSIWRILRHELHWRPYHFHQVNRLTPSNHANRVAFCRWVKTQDATWEDRVIWSDEKWFVLHQAPNSQNNRIWAPFDPHEEVACRFQGDNKVMAWVGIVAGKVLTVRWMDEPHRPKTVTGDSYHAMVTEEIWPEVKGRATRNRWWWMQDGAPVHCTRKTLDFVEDKFGGRVISRKSDISWPPYSPDLNPHDYFLGGYAMAEVWRQKPETMEQLKQVIEEMAASMSRGLIRNSVANLRKRVDKCLEVGGGHFEFLL